MLKVTTYLGGSATVFAGIDDPGTLEALACREALMLANDLQLDNLKIASDCKTVIEDIKVSLWGGTAQL